MLKNLKPLSNRVLVQLKDIEKKTESGLYLPDSAQDVRSNIGTVIAVGPGGLWTDGRSTPMSVQVGDTVYLGTYGGIDIGDNLLIVREYELLGVIPQ